MKKLLVYFMIFLFTITSGVAIAGQGNRGKYDRGTQFERDQRDAREYRKQHPRKDHHQWRGYRDRYHGHRQYHPKHYRGHWQSWHDWERYYHKHRHEYKHHRYYRQGGSLYFEFETEEGRFAFSIGR